MEPDDVDSGTPILIVEPLPAWKRTWRQGIVPLSQITFEGLKALYEALLEDSPKIIQGATTTPPPLMAMQDWPVEACDALTYIHWQGEESVTVGEAEEFFAVCCFDCDQLMGEPAACRHYLNWYDDAPRDEMIRELLPEVARAMELKKEEMR